MKLQICRRRFSFDALERLVFIHPCRVAGLKQIVPALQKLNLLRQICNFIPEFLVAKIARETKVDERARTFSPWSHVVAFGLRATHP